MLCIPWISRHTVSRCLCRRTHGELIHICLTYDDCPCLFQILYSLRRIGRNEITQNPGRTGSQHAFCTHIILDCDRNTCKWTCQFSCFNLFLNCGSLCKCSFFINCHIGMDCLVHVADSVKHCLHCLNCSSLTGFDRPGKFHCTIC